MIDRVLIRNYKSIARCDVPLGPLTFLVGRNGSGKSNFLDALRFIADALRTSLDHALRERGGVKEVRRRSVGHPDHFSIGLRFSIRHDGRQRYRGSYSFEISARKDGFAVEREACEVGDTTQTLGQRAHYRVRGGAIEDASSPQMPPVSGDRLYLVHAGGLPQFRPVYDALSGMGFYNLGPARIRELQQPDPGDLLEREGRNLASVLRQLAVSSPSKKQRIEDYLARVAPGVTHVDQVAIGHMESLEFRQEMQGAKEPWRFPAVSMSDGTLRALGVLVALFQTQNNGRGHDGLIGIEEPEVALHPAASGVLVDALRDASSRKQVIVTSHSPDLLDHESITPEEVIAVVNDRGDSRIAPLDARGKSALRDHLFTAGELLRMDQLEPDPVQSRPTQLELFGEEP